MYHFGVGVFFLSLFFAATQPRSFLPAHALSTMQTYQSHTYEDNQLASILIAINKARRVHNLPELHANSALTTVANARAQDMQRNKYYAHLSPVSNQMYYDSLEQQGMRAGYSCENLDLSLSTNPDSYVRDWLDSNKGHKDCLLHESISQIGLAVTTVNLDGTNKQLVVAIHKE